MQPPRRACSQAQVAVPVCPLCRPDPGLARADVDTALREDKTTPCVGSRALRQVTPPAGSDGNEDSKYCRAPETSVRSSANPQSLRT